MSSNAASGGWLVRYGGGFHTWRKEEHRSKVTFRRPIGLVEGFFDSDGTDKGGRSDLHSILDVEIRTTLSPERIRRRILLAWANLRRQHALLGSSVSLDGQTNLRTFIVPVPQSAEAAVEEAHEYIDYIEDTYPDVEFGLFFEHTINTGRIPSASDSISRLLVLPSRRTARGTLELTLLQIAGHMVLDGLTSFNWSSHLLHLLNEDEDQLLAQLACFSQEQSVQKLLPPAQEDLYPAVPGSKARQRWFWAIMRILRHVRKPIQEGFINPLRRKERPSPRLPLPPKYPKLLDYRPGKQPPLESGSLGFVLSVASSRRVAALARAAGASVGAGIFALVALVMMELETQAHPDVPLSERKPFVASFPLNPRPWLNYKGPPDSCMLAFSEGIVLPWLPIDLDLEGRFKLLCKRAHDGLRSYQKRAKDPVKADDSHSPLRIIASGYLSRLEQQGFDVQGAYPAKAVMGGATCGVSSVGSVKEFLHKAMYPLDEHPEKDFVADFCAVRHGVRARENEFLNGVVGYGDGTLHFGVSYDATAMDDALVKQWQGRMLSIIEPQRPKL